MTDTPLAGVSYPTKVKANVAGQNKVEFDLRGMGYSIKAFVVMLVNSTAKQKSA